MSDRPNQKRSPVTLTYGMRSDAIINTTEISSDENGKKCGCVCPQCGAPLVARTQGSIRRPHFAHAKDSSCDVVSAQQTALHLLAKEIIAREKKVFLPSIEFSRPNFSDRGWELEVAAMLPLSKVVSPARQWTCDSVDVERSESGYIPDIRVMIQGKPCLIEIAVTHFVDEEKKEKIIDSKLPLIEIDLSALQYEDIDPDTLRHLLTETSENRVTTLSGGEKFLLALSLAIGLSTVVQAQSGGTKLDAMFIDEGFGSLDSECINDAMDILQGIQKSHGLVGIISHVEKLSEIIPTRLEVVTSANGNYIKPIIA